MRTIRVTGKGKIKVKPDMTRLTITLEGTYCLSMSIQNMKATRNMAHTNRN